MHKSSIDVGRQDAVGGLDKLLLLIASSPDGGEQLPPEDRERERGRRRWRLSSCHSVVSSDRSSPSSPVGPPELPLQTSGRLHSSWPDNLVCAGLARPGSGSGWSATSESGASSRGPDSDADSEPDIWVRFHRMRASVAGTRWLSGTVSYSPEPPKTVPAPSRPTDTEGEEEQAAEIIILGRRAGPTAGRLRLRRNGATIDRHRRIVNHHRPEGTRKSKLDDDYIKCNSRRDNPHKQANCSLAGSRLGLVSRHEHFSTFSVVKQQQPPSPTAHRHIHDEANDSTPGHRAQREPILPLAYYHPPRSCSATAVAADNNNNPSQSSSSLDNTRSTTITISAAASSSWRLRQHDRYCEQPKRPKASRPGGVGAENAKLTSDTVCLEDTGGLRSSKQRALENDNNEDKHQQQPTDERLPTSCSLAAAAANDSLDTSISTSTSDSFPRPATKSRAHQLKETQEKGEDTREKSKLTSGPEFEAPERSPNETAINKRRPRNATSNTDRADSPAPLGSGPILIHEADSFVEISLTEAKQETGSGSFEQPEDEHHSEVMEVLRGNQHALNQHHHHHQQSTATINNLCTTPCSYPNNTLLVDLNKCHSNLTRLWPSSGRLGKSSTAPARLLMKFKTRRRQPDVEDADQEQSAGSKSSDSNEQNNKKTVKLNYKFNMPESLLRTNIKIKLDDYDKALSILTSDIRYQLHLLLYRRVQSIWLLLSTIFCIVTPIMLANFEFTMIIGACGLWLGLQAMGAIATSTFRQKLNEMLERSVAQANTFFMDHHLMLGVINEGSLFSKTKLMVPMLYFDTSQCREQIESILSAGSPGQPKTACESNILVQSKIDLPFTTTKSTTQRNPMALAQSQLAKRIVLSFSQRWISHYDKRKLMFTDDRVKSRHLSTGKCLCQFIEDHVKGHPESYRKEEQLLPQLTTSCRNELTATLPRQKVINKDATLPREMIATLSRQVSLRDEPEEEILKSPAKAQVCATKPINMHQYNNTDTKTNGNLVRDNSPEQQPEEERARNNASPGYLSLELSINLDDNNGTIGSSEDLIRKLRLLLEQRKNQLQAIDGYIFSSLPYANQQQLFHPIPDNKESYASQTIRRMAAHNKPNHPQVFINDRMSNIQPNEETSPDNGRKEMRGRKKFFSQRDGGLFFGGSKDKVHHRQHEPPNDMTLSSLPKLPIGHRDHFKSTLEGSYTLTVVKVTDISKPTQKPIDEVEEPEEDEVAQQNKLNKGNARMIQLQLVDNQHTEIMAIETEKIEKLTFIKPKCLISIQGPVELRCRNLMLQNKHVTHIQHPPKEEPKPERVQGLPSADSKPDINITVNSPDESTITHTNTTARIKTDMVEVKPELSNRDQPQLKENQEVVIIDEDWDEDDEDDCIVLN